jgi:uncharacterized LabA/DUF88 family protein
MNNQPNTAVVYVDYENIFEILKQYGKDLLEMDFFRVIQENLKAKGLNIIDIIVFGNFDKKLINSKQQTALRAMGLETRQASNNGKNCGDLELTVNVLRDLYKNPNINVFVVISSDRDFIPLLKEIRYENKLAYVISTRRGFNQTVAEYASIHEYIEDIFSLNPLDSAIINQDPSEASTAIDLLTVGPEKIARAREVAYYFYQSHIWKQAFIFGTPVSLKGYLDVLIKVIKRSADDILEDFKLAHCLKYVTIYQDSIRGLCVKEGERRKRVIHWDYKNTFYKRNQRNNS